MFLVLLFFSIWQIFYIYQKTSVSCETGNLNADKSVYDVINACKQLSVNQNFLTLILASKLTVKGNQRGPQSR